MGIVVNVTLGICTVICAICLASMVVRLAIYVWTGK